MELTYEETMRVLTKLTSGELLEILGLEDAEKLLLELQDYVEFNLTDIVANLHDAGVI